MLLHAHIDLPGIVIGLLWKYMRCPACTQFIVSQKVLELLFSASLLVLS